jgi:hypothetical protein
MANSWNTLHIFGFGTVQAISDTQNVQAPISAFQAEVDAVVNDVWNNKPAGYTGPKTFHAINNFDGLFSDWLPNEPNVESFRVQAADLDQSLLDALADGVLAYVPPTTTTTTTKNITTTSTTTAK